MSWRSQRAPPRSGPERRGQGVIDAPGCPCYKETVIALRGEEVTVRELRINERIRAREVRVIGDQAEQLGVMPLAQALQLARERGTDLVEVAPTAVPPVCKFLDYGRFKYQQARKARESRKGQKTNELREIRIRPKIDEHDIAFKLRLVKKLLSEGDKVKVAVIFRGREITHPDIAKGLLERAWQSVKDEAIIERPPAMEGRNMSVIFAPGRRAAAKAPEAQPAATSQETAATPAPAARSNGA